MKTKSALRSFLSLAGSCLLASPAVHAGQIWDGGGTDDNWSTAGNWDGNSGGVLPTFTNAITFTGNTRNGAVNDRIASSTIGGINLANDGSTGKTNAFTLSGNSITLGGNIATTANIAGTTITDTISLAMSLNGNRIITTNQLSSAVQHNLTISGVISQDASARSLTKAGVGALTLNGSTTNTFTGGVTVSAGTLALDYANIAASTNLLTSQTFAFNNGGNLTLKGKTGANLTTQSMGNLTVNAGGGTMLIDPNGGTSTTLSLGTLAPAAAGSSLTLGRALGAGSGAVELTTTTSKNLLDTYGGRIVFASGTAATGYDWATTASVASPYSLSAYSGYATMATSGTDTLNSRITTSGSLSGALTTDTLKIEDPAASQSLDLGVNTLTLTGGGLLVSGTNSTAVTGSAGNLLTAGNGSGAYDLIVHQYNSGGLDIAAVIGNNDVNATALTKAGTGALTLSAANTFTGGLFVNAGEVVIANAGALFNTAGSENAVTLGAGTVSLNGNSLVVRSLTSSNPASVVRNANATTATLTVGNSGNAASTYAGSIQDGTGGGALALAKSGTGNLTLSGASTYTGGTFLNAGRTIISADNNLGATTGALTFNASAQFQATGVTLARDIGINSGAIASFGGNSVTTVTGNVSGAGGIAASSFNFGSVVVLNGTNNTFQGPVNIGTGGSGGNQYYLSTASLADSATANGNITLDYSGNYTTNPFGFWWTGATNLTLNNRAIIIANTGGTPGNNIINNSATANVAIAVNTNLQVTTTSATTLVLGGSNSTGANAFSTNITNGSSSALSLTKTGASNWALSGTANSFTGTILFNSTTVTAGTLSYASAVGTNPITFNQTTGFNTTLSYTGASPLTMSGLISAAALTTGGIIIDASGTAPTAAINYSNTASLSTTSTGTSTRFITFGGSNTGDNTFAGAINNNTGVGGNTQVAKQGLGKWLFTGNGNFSGGLFINNGTVSVNSIPNGGVNSPLGVNTRINLGRDNNNGILIYTGSGDSTNRDTRIGGPSTASGTGGSSILNDGSGTLTFTAATFNVSQTGIAFTRTLTLGGSYTGGSNEIQGVIQNNTATTGLVNLEKTGAGTWKLSGANTYTGNTNVNAGTLELADNAQLKFALGATSGTNNSITGAGTVTLNGDFVIDTTAADTLPSGTWTLENVTSLSGPYGSTFTVVGFTNAGSDKWTKVNGSKLYTFDETTGVLTLAAAAGYSSWASLNGAGANLNDDHDNDGVNNGTEYFLGGPNGNTTGFTALPGVVNTAGTLSVTWPKGAGYNGAYGTDFTVETSATLADPWTVESVGGNVTDSASEVKYTFPGGPAYSGKNFTRLKVTGP